MSPPSGGPAVRPIATTVPTAPSARPRIPGGNDAVTTAGPIAIIARRPERLEDAGGDERAEPGREPAERRAEREDEEARRVEGAVPEPVSEPPGEEQASR